MASQCLQLSQSARLCMPLAKFSYANVPAGSVGPIPWTHISSQNDLFVLLDPVEASTQQGAPDRRYRFKVLQDPNLHDDLDLSLLAHEARRAVDEAQKSLVPGRQPSITIIVKTPCVAMRYPLADGQIRRFQVRYMKEEDFYETLKLFASHKLPFIEAGTVLNQPAPSTHHNNLATHAYGNDAFQVPKSGSGSIKPSETYLQQSFPTHTLRHSKPEAEHSQNSEAIRTSQTSSQQCLAVSQPLHEAKASVTHTITSSAVPLLQTSAHTDSRHLTGLSSSMPALQQPFISTYAPRPSTAPTAKAKDMALELPPKRQLPFGRKKIAVQAAAADITEVAGQQILCDMAPKVSSDKSPVEKQVVNLPQNKTTKYRTRSKTKAQKLSDKAESSIANHNETGTETLNVQRGSGSGSNSKGAPTHLDTQALLNRAESIQKSRNAKQSIQNLAKAGPEARDRHRIGTHVSSRDHSTEPVGLKQTPRTSHPSANSSPQRQDQDNSALALLLTDPNFAHPTIPGITPTSQSPSEPKPDFWSLSQDEQHTHLETWIVQNLENPNFVQLCKSLEGVWQRIFVKV